MSKKKIMVSSILFGLLFGFILMFGLRYLDSYQEKRIQVPAHCQPGYVAQAGELNLPCERSYTGVWKFRSTFGFNDELIFGLFVIIGFILSFAVLSAIQKKSNPEFHSRPGPQK